MQSVFLMQERRYTMRNAFSREKQIQQVKDCGQEVINKAEEIYGKFEYPTDLKIIIAVSVDSLPFIKVERSFISAEYVESQVETSSRRKKGTNDSHKVCKGWFLFI